MSVKIMVPEMGESVVDARVRRWLKQAGDAVTVGEPLVELETDKVDVEVSASKSGVLAAIAHPEGADVKIGDTLGTIDEVQGSGGPEVKGSRGPEVLGSLFHLQRLRQDDCEWRGEEAQQRAHLRFIQMR